MTRINAFIPPANLSDSHLMAEIKEINQLCGSYKKSLNSKNGIKDIPFLFTLNKGHVSHFYDKAKFLHKRFNSLKEEALNRGFNVTVNFNVSVWKEEHYKNYYISDLDIKRAKQILHERIILRLSEQTPKYKIL